MNNTRLRSRSRSRSRDEELLEEQQLVLDKQTDTIHELECQLLLNEMNHTNATKRYVSRGRKRVVEKQQDKMQVLEAELQLTKLKLLNSKKQSRKEKAFLAKKSGRKLIKTKTSLLRKKELIKLMGNQFDDFNHNLSMLNRCPVEYTTYSDANRAHLLECGHGLSLVAINNLQEGIAGVQVVECPTCHHLTQRNRIVECFDMNSFGNAQDQLRTFDQLKTEVNQRQVQLVNEEPEFIEEEVEDLEVV